MSGCSCASAEKHFDFVARSCPWKQIACADSLEQDSLYGFGAVGSGHEDRSFVNESMIAGDRPGVEMTLGNVDVLGSSSGSCSCWVRVGQETSGHEDQGTCGHQVGQRNCEVSWEYLGDRLVVDLQDVA